MMASVTSSALERRSDVSHLIAVIVLVAASTRNPFQYVEAPKPKPKPVKKAVERRPLRPPVSEPVTPPAAEAAAAPPPLPEFPYHLIGRFGRNDDPIVAFSGKGQVITVRTGDTIEDTFIIRRIGLESVEIGFVNRTETLRLQLDGSV